MLGGLKSLLRRPPKLELPAGVDFAPSPATVLGPRAFNKRKEAKRKAAGLAPRKYTNCMPKGWTKLPLKVQESLWKTRT